MSDLGWVHLICSFWAIGAGAVVLLRPKGTRWHRTFGHMYVSGMLGIVVTSFALFGLTGRVTPFHLAAVVAGLTIIGGLYTVLRRRPKKRWIDAHATWMSWSYVGLMAALASESLTRFVMPRAEPFFEERGLWGVFWSSVVLATLLVFAGGFLIIHRRLRPAIEATPHAMRRERDMLRGLEGAGTESA